MSEKAFPLNDIDYTAEDLRMWHAGRTPGVRNLSDSDLVVSPFMGMQVQVSSGLAYLFTDINATGGLMYQNDNEVSITCDIAGSMDRYDYISVRYTKETNTCALHYQRGNTVKPNPVRTTNIWELIIAIIKIPANAGSITAADIIDTRMDENYCGIMIDSLARIPTDTYQSQFMDWFDNIKDVLDEDTAGHLQNEIDDLNGTLNNSVANINAYLSQKADTIELAAAATSPTTKSYAAGTYLIYNNHLYKVLKTITNGESLAVGTNISAITMTQIVSEAVASAVSGLKTNINGLLMTKKFSASTGSINGNNNKSVQIPAATPSGYKAIAVVAFSMSGTGSSVVQPYGYGLAVNQVWINLRNLDSNAHNVNCEVTVLYQKTL